ncbi:MAG: hypothetical protein IKO39_00750 [Treponema sp.]|nr:hypothetical protein [Treponema sp.]
MMKISKLLKVGAFALLAASLCFVSCGKDDDENQIIQGNGNNKSVDYFNDTSATAVTDGEKPAGTCRGYSSTALQHQGELVRICLSDSKGTTTESISKYPTKTYGGVMGFIWDLNTSKVDSIDDKDTNRNFWILGLAVGSDGSDTTKVKYYISRYFNVKDISAKNFGSSITVTSSSEVVSTETVYEYVKTNFTDLTNTTDDKLYIWVDIYPTLKTGVSAHVPGTQDLKENYTGGWSIDFYKANSDGSINTSEKYNTQTISISPEETGYTAATVTSGTANPMPENYMACYANVYNNKRVTGEWFLKSDYFVDNIVEE